MFQIVTVLLIFITYFTFLLLTYCILGLLNKTKKGGLQNWCAKHKESWGLVLRHHFDQYGGAFATKTSLKASDR